MYVVTGVSKGSSASIFRAKSFKEFTILRTVHLRIILVGNQLVTQFLLLYIYLNPLHVSSNRVLILRRTIVLIQLLV